jgi:hypothetical protein
VIFTWPTLDPWSQAAYEQPTVNPMRAENSGWPCQNSSSPYHLGFRVIVRRLFD